jgi:hypothetical protein
MLPTDQWVWPANLVVTFFIITSLLMVSQVEMFSFKFKPGGIAANKTQTAFAILGVLLSIGVYALFQNWLFIIPLLILLYIVTSIATFIWKNNV